MVFTQALIYSFIAGLSTIAGVYLVRSASDWTKRNSLLMISFAGGVLVATGMAEILPEAADLTTYWAVPALAGLVLLFIIEHFMAIHECQEEACDIHGVGMISAMGIGVHSLIDGIVIAAGFQAGTAIGIIASLAVVVHELPEGVFTYGLLIANGETPKRSMIISWIVALATPFGTVITFFALRGLGEGILGAMLAFSAGTFLYVGSADLLPQIHRRPNKNLLLVMLAGVAFVFIVQYFVG